MAPEEYRELVDFLGTRFDAVDRRFETMDRRFDAMDERFDAMDRRFDRMDERVTKNAVSIEALWDDVRKVAEGVAMNGKRLDRVETRLESVERTVEAHDAKLVAIDGRLVRIEERVDGIDVCLVRVEDPVVSIGARIGTVEEAVDVDGSANWGMGAPRGVSGTQSANQICRPSRIERISSICAIILPRSGTMSLQRSCARLWASSGSSGDAWSPRPRVPASTGVAEYLREDRVEDDHTQRWTVFSADGRRVLGWYAAPQRWDRFVVKDIGEDWMLVLERDELDVEYLRLYRIVAEG